MLSNFASAEKCGALTFRLSYNNTKIMRAYPIPLSLTTASTVAPAPFPTTIRFLLAPSVSEKPTSLCFSTSYSRFLFSKSWISPLCSYSDASTSDTNEEGGSDNDDDDVYLNDGELVWSDEKTKSLYEDGFFIEIEKLEGNSRRIRSKIGIEASLDTVWEILTDFEKLTDICPGIIVSKVVEKKDNFFRLYQIGQQNLAMGFKFNAKGVLDCYEKDLEILPDGRRREIQFKMVEGDFACFEGTWAVEEVNNGKFKGDEAFADQEFQTTLSYSVDVKPKMWLPVRLIEGRLSSEIKINLSCIRDEAKRVKSGLSSH